MDRTPQWRAIIGDAQGTSAAPDVASLIPSAFRVSSKDIWAQPPSAFTEQAQGLNRSLAELREFLTSQAGDYVDLMRHIPCLASSMTDQERDAIDSEAAIFIASCAQGIEALRVLMRQRQIRRKAAQEADDSDASDTEQTKTGAAPVDTVTAHQAACVTFLLERSRSVAAILESMQAERLKVAKAASASFARRETPPQSTPQRNALEFQWPRIPPSTAEQRQAAAQIAAQQEEEEADMRQTFPRLFDRLSDNSNNSHTERSVPLTASVRPDNHSVPASSTRPAGSPKRKQVTMNPVPEYSALQQDEQDDSVNTTPASSAAGITQQSVQMTAELQTELQGAQQVEEKMTEISHLMALFASKVIEQQDEMEDAFSFAVTAHENVKSGGKHLDKAEERGSTFRKFYVGFMMFMTFALLFLHAINP